MSPLSLQSAQRRGPGLSSACSHARLRSPSSSSSRGVIPMAAPLCLLRASLCSRLVRNADGGTDRGCPLEFLIFLPSSSLVHVPRLLSHPSMKSFWPSDEFDLLTSIWRVIRHEGWRTACVCGAAHSSQRGDVCQRSYFEQAPLHVYCCESVCSFFSFISLSVGCGRELVEGLLAHPNTWMTRTLFTVNRPAFFN